MIKILTAPDLLDLVGEVGQLQLDGWVLEKVLMNRRHRVSTWYVVLRKEV